MKLLKSPFPVMLPACLLAVGILLSACGGGSSTPAATAQTIAFTSPANQTFGASPPALSATASSGLPTTITSKTMSVCTVNGTTVTLVAVGTCTLAADQAGNASFAAAPEQTVSFTVAQGQQSVTFTSPGNQTLGTAAPALVATASSGLPVTITSQTSGVCTVSGTTLTLVAAGTCTLAADQGGSANYAAAPEQTVSFTVASCGAGTPAAGDLISFDDPTQTYTVAAFNGDTGAVVTDPANGCNMVGTVTRTPASQYDGATFGTLAPATSPTIPAIPFTATSNTLTLRVYVPSAPTLVHLKIENAANGAINYETEVNATQANSWQTLTFPLNAPLVGGLPGQAFNLANTYNRVSVFFGFGSVQSASPATFYFDDLTLNNGSAGPGQTITFTSPGNQTLGSSPAPLVATASSGLPVTITSQTTSVCTVSGTALTLVAAGTCTLAADQAGDVTYNAAPEVTVSFSVAPPAAPTNLVSFDDPTQTYTVAAFNGDTGSVATDPAGGSNQVGLVTRTPGSQYDGATFGTLAPTTSPTIPAIPFTATSNTLTLRVYVPSAPTLVHLKIENAANGAINYETEVNATQANSWQTLTFPLNAPLVGGLPGQAFNLANTYNRVSVFFGFGSVQGASAATYYFDDLALVP
jgi:N-acetylmuramoyl-L-alanine amidase CwlA